MAKRGRDDPYKGFNFRILFGTVATAVAGLAIVKKLMRRRSAERLYPGVYVSEEPSGSRPIEGVGTTVAAGRTAAKSKPKGRSGSRRSATASGTRRTRAAKPKRR